MPLEHSNRGPSGAHRWRKCHAAPTLEAGLPDCSGKEAALGTVFHEYAAMCLELGLDPHVFIGAECDTGPRWGTLVFDDEMARSMLQGLDYCRDLAEEPGAEMFVEVRVDISPWCGPGEFGTSDVIIINLRKLKVTVFDWKYGAGVPVQPEWNDQAILYFLGSWNTIIKKLLPDDFDPADLDVDIVIEQPRADGGGGVWHTDAATLLKEGKKIKRDADLTHVENPIFDPGPKQCFFCKGAALKKCEAHANFILSVFDTKLDEIDEYIEAEAILPLPDALTPEQRAFVLLNKDMVVKWFNDLHADAYNDAMNGKPTPFQKLVEGRRPARAWKDEEKAKVRVIRAFGEAKAYTRKLLSPAQVQDEVGKKEYMERFAHFVNVGKAKPELVPETDRRDPLPDHEARFDAAMDETSLV